MDEVEQVLEPGSVEQEEYPPLDLKALALKVLVGFLLVVGVVALVAHFYFEPIVAFSGHFVKKFGGFGVAFGWFLIDGFTVPLPNDIFSFFGVQGKMGFWEVVFWALGGSMSGGVAAYWIGNTLRRNQRFLAFMEGRGAEAYNLIRRYGLVALFIAALTPVPFSIASMACGVVRVKMWHFLLISLARLPRIALYLWAIQIGLITMKGVG